MPTFYLNNKTSYTNIFIYEVFYFEVFEGVETFFKKFPRKNLSQFTLSGNIILTSPSSLS